jgi:hypothetical protein
MFKIISPVIGNVASESLEACELFLGFSTGCVVYDALGSALRGTLAPLRHFPHRPLPISCSCNRTSSLTFASHCSAIFLSLLLIFFLL